MRRSSVFALLGCFLALMGVLGVSAFAQSGNPRVDSSLGTWKFIPENSSSTSSNPLKSRTEVVEAAPGGWYRVTRTDLRADGTSLQYSYTFKYDGKEYLVVGALFDTIAQTRLDANTTTFEVKRTGTPYHMKGRFTISEDGRTRTQVESGIGLDGKAAEVRRVYEKQQ